MVANNEIFQGYQLYCNIYFVIIIIIIPYKPLKRKQKDKIIISIGIGVISLIIALAVYLQLENAKIQAYTESYGRLVADSRLLTQSYQSEIGKWKSKQYDNATMVSITDKYLPKFQSLVDRAGQLQPPEKYAKSRDFSIQSFRSEIESYKHFRNFLTTGNGAEDIKSTQLLSDALRYESYAFAAFYASH